MTREVVYVTAGEPSPVYELDVGRYPAGEPLVRSDHIPTRVLLRPKSLESFFTALFWLDALGARGYPMPAVILPAVPGARQDRLLREKGADQLFTVRSVAQALNARNLPGVAVIDPHSDVTPALIDRCHVVSAADVFRTVQSTWDAVVAPDGGAAKRAGAVAQLLRLPLFHGWKRRDVETGKLSGFGIEPLPHSVRNLLFVDDICDGGGTFLGLAEHIRLAYGTGMNISLYVSHGYFTQGTEPLTRTFNRVLTTDSVMRASEGVEVLDASMALLLGGAL